MACISARVDRWSERRCSMAAGFIQGVGVRQDWDSQHHPVSGIWADGIDAPEEAVDVGAALLSESWYGATMTERVSRRSCRVQAHLTTFREHSFMTVVRESQPQIHGKEVMFPIHFWFGLNTTVPDVLVHHMRIPRLRPDAELPSIADPRVC